MTFDTLLAGDQTDNAIGQPQSNLWFGNIDELWNWGKPSGWGAVWRNESVSAGKASEPFLMTGFDKKVIHFYHDNSKAVDFDIEVDFLGNGQWVRYKTVSVAPKGYNYHVFTDGYTAHWVRIKPKSDCNATVQFIYN